MALFRNYDEIFNQIFLDIKKCWDKEEADVKQLIEFISSQNEKLKNFQVDLEVLKNRKIEIPDNKEIEKKILILEEKLLKLEEKFEKVMDLSNKMYLIIDRVIEEKKEMESETQIIENKTQNTEEAVHKIGEEIKQIEEKTEEKELAYVGDEITAMCWKCRKYMPFKDNQAEVIKTKGGPMYKGVCALCFSPMVRKAKIKDVINFIK